MLVKTEADEYIRMYGAVMQVIRPCLSRSVCRNHEGIAEIIMGSYLADTGNYGSLSSASRWHSGARSVPIAISDYYADADGVARMRQDIVDGLMPHVMTPDTLVADLIEMISTTLALDLTVRARLLRHRPNGPDGDLAGMLADILCYAMQ